MKRTLFLILPLFTLVFVFVQACGDDDDGSGKGGKSGGRAGKGGASGNAGSVIKDGTNITFSKSCDGAPPFDSQTCANPYCPDVSAEPSLKEAGDCCKRVDLAALNKGKDAADQVYEYRIMMNRVLSLPNTIGLSAIQDAMGTYYDQKASITLYRFKGDLSTQGEISGETGPGVYNCDGTYSFYGEGTASTAPSPTWSTNPDRFMPSVMKGTWYPDEGRLDTDRKDLKKTTFGIPTYNYSEPGFPLAYESPAKGGALLKFPIAPEQPDCVGSRSESGWTLEGINEAYFLLDDLKKVTNIPRIGNPGQSSCQLDAFYILAQGKEKTTTCDMERCDINADAACAWKELPDSLCPTNAAEEDTFPCHVGDKKKAAELKLTCDGKQYTDFAPKQWCETINKWPKPPCSDSSPTSFDDTPQCCDPLGKDATLPACNAWRMVFKFSAAAVEITDKPTTKLATNCQ